MQPLEDLLHRIRWDAEFGRGTFALGYYDRVLRGEIVVPLTSVAVDPATSAFTFADDEGGARTVPLHRVRTVYKDGVAIWRRPAPAESRPIDE
jgi:uncharacterized protein (UPF0248 family)